MRKTLLPITVGVLGSLALAVSASGQYINVTAEYFDAGAPEGFETWRIVAHFQGEDIMLFWGAFPGEGDLIFFNCNGVDLLNAGGVFSGLKAEDFARYPVSALYDSWVTVGSTVFAGNQTDYTRGFIGSDGTFAAVVGNSFSDVAGFVFDSDPTSPILGPDVVMAQFTIPEANFFHLEGVVGWNPAGAGPGFNVSSFEVSIPCSPQPPTGACCLADGSCSVLELDDCNLASGTYQGDDTDCRPDLCPFPCPWDIDGNGSVGASDLLSLLVSWGPCNDFPCNDCLADFDHNCIVGASDLLALLVNWGLCP